MRFRVNPLALSSHLGVARSNPSPRLGQWLMTNGRVTKDKENLPSNHSIQNELPCFLNSFSESSLGEAGSRVSHRLGQWFMSHGFH